MREAKTPYEVTLKCKLRMERKRIRELEERIHELHSEISFKEKALAKAAVLIDSMDKDGELWKRLMQGKL